MSTNIPSHNQSLEEYFAYVTKSTEERKKKITNVVSGIKETLADELKEQDRQNIHSHLEELDKAFCIFREEADHPELVLATTGTTSSGKSTLANFLIGEAILPSAVQEMSAGLVRVKHSDERSLEIPQTKGATWDTGRWDDLTADEISQRLEDTMEAFRKEENRNKEIEPVLFEIKWPIRLAERKKELGLPEGTQITILDLPGLKAVNDERNGPVIRKNIAKAFCLIAYNAEETDKQKQQKLLDEVVSQVMALGYGKEGGEEDTETSQRRGQVSDLSRMLFLLNRIDVFWRDRSPEENFRKFKTDITVQIQEKLKRKLPEHQKTIEAIDLAQICSMPALLAVGMDRLWEKPEDQVKVLEKLEVFKYILPKDDKGKNCLHRFPRDLEELNNSEEYPEEERRTLIKKLIDDTLEGSKANNFEQRLTTHIAKNLPEIIVGGSLNLYAQKEKLFLFDLALLCESHITRTAEEAEARKAELKNAEEIIFKESNNLKILFEPLKEFCQNYHTYKGADKTTKLAKICDSLAEEAGLEDTFFAPLKNAELDVLKIPLRQLSGYVNDCFVGFKEVEETEVEETEVEETEVMWPFGNTVTLKNTLKSLYQTRYCHHWEEGGRISSENNTPYKVQRALEKFFDAFLRTLSDGVSTALEAVSKRIYDCFSQYITLLLERMRKTCQDKLIEFEGLVSVFDKGLTLTPPSRLNIENTYEIDEVSEERKTREVEKEGFWAWLFGLTKTERYDEFSLPVKPLAEYMDEIGQTKGLQDIEKKIFAYSYDLIDDFLRQFDSILQEGVIAYHQAIDDSVRGITDDTQKKNEMITLYKEKIQELLP